MTFHKQSLEELKSGMQVFLHFPAVEKSIERESQNILQKILLSKTRNGDRLPHDVLVDYLNAGDDTDLRLKLLIGFGGGSYEKFQRIFKLLSPDSTPSQIKRSENIRSKVANFLLNTKNLSNEVSIPFFIKQGFSLPKNWQELLRDEDYLKPIIFQKILPAKYSTSIGEALEDEIRKVVVACDMPYAKGNVDIASRKEIDVAIPNIKQPKIIIMSSYQITTSSSQSSKANEQSRIFNNIQDHNRVLNYDGFQRVFFINVIDGGGWLGRPRDLEKMWRYSDYCFAYSQLNYLKNFLLYYKKETEI